MKLQKRYGEYAFITGASSGIGRSFAYLLAEKGMNLILAARRIERLNEIKEDIKSKFNRDVFTIQVDLTEDYFLELIIKQTEGKNVGILVNNAGIGSPGYFHNNDPAHDANLVKLNCIAPTILTHHFVKPMIERNKGAVIFLGSLVAINPTPLMAVYSASKAFNQFLGNALWYELKKSNIDVLTVNPGSTDTEFKRLTVTESNHKLSDADDVASASLNVLGKKISYTHGFKNKLSHIPRRLFSQKFTANLIGSIALKFNKEEK